ncbi:MAG: AEC family transporter [Paracoccaceae bacterium]|nr:AEC family transporter [Paracoccaceae bacterium]
MSLIAALLVIVLPVFLVVGTGYALVRIKFFPDAGVDALVRFATALAVPCLLFKAMYELDLGTAMRADHLIAFYGASLACFTTAALISRKLFTRRPGEAVSAGFSAMFGNAVLLGIPIMQRAFGAAELSAMFALLAFHVPVFYTVGILAMELLRRDGRGAAGALLRTVRAVAANPLMLGLAFGLAANIAGLGIPGVLYDAISMLARAALPVALFALGGVLTRYALKAELGEATMISLVSLMLCPALAWLLSGPVFGLPEPFLRAAVLMAAMPPGVNGYVFAAMYNRAVGTAASAVILGTILSLATISLWLALLGGSGV